MLKRMTIVREPIKILTQYTPQQFQAQQHHTTRENYATEALIQVAEDQQQEKVVKTKQRQDHNGSEITCWKNNYLNNINILKQQCQNHRRKRNFKIRLERQSLREQPYIDHGCVPSNIGLSIKKQINKLRLPLRQRTFNSEQFASLVVEKERSKTRNQIKLQIMNCKQQIASSVKPRQKVKNGWKCYSIIKDRDETRQYRKIKRKDFYTIQNDDECISEQNMARMLRTRSKYESGYALESPKIMNLKGSSIKRLFIE